MPTKDQLLEQLAVANARVKELEDAPQGEGGEGEKAVLDGAGELLLEGELYHMSDGELAHVEGPYAADGKAVTLTEDGEFHIEPRASVEGVEGLNGTVDAIINVVGLPAWLTAWRDVVLNDPDSAAGAITTPDEAGPFDDNSDVAQAQRWGELGNMLGDMSQHMPSDELFEAVLKTLVASGESDEVAMLKSDVQRLTVERDEARNARDLATKRLQDSQTLHGSIDSLKPVA